ncbi:TPA: hypothetical protein N0F65_001914, partial [Lagenidium giganteum]
ATDECLDGPDKTSTGQNLNLVVGSIVTCHCCERSGMTDAHRDVEQIQRIRTAVLDAQANARERELPFLTLTYAQSIDGSIAAKQGIPTLISGAESMHMTHVLRTIHDAILVGVGTIIADNPSLNARFAQGKNPRPVIVDSSLRCPLSIKLFTSPSCEKPIILCLKSSADAGVNATSLPAIEFINITDCQNIHCTATQARRDLLIQAGAEIIECRGKTDDAGYQHVDLRHAFELLKQRGIRSIMIEGGSSILTSCLMESASSHFVDLVVVTIAPCFIGGLRAVNKLLETARPCPRLSNGQFHQVGTDVVIIGNFSERAVVSAVAEATRMLLSTRQRLSISNANALANFNALQTAFTGHRIVIFLDYDGTLTPIVSDPASAHLHADMRRTLEQLHTMFVTGVISGRSLAKIQAFVSIPQLYYAGSHGFDIAGPNDTAIKNQVAADFLEELSKLRDDLKARVAGIPRAEIEDNTFSISLHYRNVDPSRHAEIMEIAHAAGDHHPRLRLGEGKMVFEFKPKIDWNKGKALIWLLQALGLDEHEDVFTIYIGDDTTDEDAFDVFRTTKSRKGVGIVVTEHSMHTGATFTLHDTDEVCKFLNKLIEFGREQQQAKPAILGLDIQHRDHISLNWNDGKCSKFHLVHLRSWCLCPSCQHETGQRLVNYADINHDDIGIEDIFVKGDTLNVVWAPDGHKSTFPWQWLRKNCYAESTLESRSKAMTPVPLPPGSEIPSCDHQALMDTNNDEGLFNVLHQIVEHGFTVVRNTPSEPGEVKRVAQRIAPVSHSFLYGDVFDVIAEQDPVNIAYTNEHLKHHLDLAYYESPPGIQMLHALRFDQTVTGGESTFVDVFAVADDFRREHPEHFQTLCRVPATFKKHHLNRSNPAVMEYQRPHIQLNHRSEVISVFWSPPFEGPLRVPYDDILPYYEAYKLFHDFVEGGKYKIEFKLQEGDTVIFNQRRMLHGRNQFSVGSSGVRHLQGTYLNIDDVFCRFNVLRHRFAADNPDVKNRRAANGNYA